MSSNTPPCIYCFAPADADELHALLQPTTTDDGGQEQLARGDAAFICDGVLRRILINTPPHVLWAVTASNMALVWMALAAMPVNGTAPLNQIDTVSSWA